MGLERVIGLMIQVYEPDSLCASLKRVDSNECGSSRFPLGQQRFRYRQKLPEGPAQLLAMVEMILTTYPKSYQERLRSVLTKFEGELKSGSTSA